LDRRTTGSLTTANKRQVKENAIGERGILTPNPKERGVISAISFVLPFVSFFPHYFGEPSNACPLPGMGYVMIEGKRSGERPTLERNRYYENTANILGISGDGWVAGIVAFCKLCPTGPGHYRASFRNGDAGGPAFWGQRGR
jgi:hypothetical protein